MIDWPGMEDLFTNPPGMMLSMLSNTFENLGILPICTLYLGIWSNNLSGSNPITFTNSS